MPSNVVDDEASQLIVELKHLRSPGTDHGSSDTIESKWRRLLGLDALESLFHRQGDTTRLGGSRTPASDVSRSLPQLQRVGALTPHQSDYLVYQQARRTIGDLVERDQAGYAQFQRRHRESSRDQAWFSESDTRRIYLNPSRTWACFATFALLRGSATPPSNVLFFAVGSEIAVAAFELEGQALINELVDYQPCTLREWADVTRVLEPGQLVDFSRELLRMGLVTLW